MFLTADAMLIILGLSLCCSYCAVVLFCFLIVIYGEQTCCQEGGAWGKDGLGV